MKITDKAVLAAMLHDANNEAIAFTAGLTFRGVDQARVNIVLGHLRDGHYALARQDLDGIANDYDGVEVADRVRWALEAVAVLNAAKAARSSLERDASAVSA